MNLKKALTIIEKQLKKSWSKLDFEFKLESEKASATASHVTLRNHDDDISVIIRVYSGGTAVFRAVFDKIEKTPGALDVVNEFNDNGMFFKAFIREDGYLELSHFIVVYDEKIFKDYVDEFMIRLSKLADDEILQKLTKHTHD